MTGRVLPRVAALLRPLGFLVAMALLIGAVRPAGLPPPFLLNLSPSVPVGVYVRSSERPQVGDWVAACMPAELSRFGRERGYLPRGTCPGGAVPVLKRWVASSGDRVALTEDGLRIGHEVQPGSRLSSTDSQGRVVPQAVQYPYRVPNGSVLLLGTRADSWDGRYFGPVPAESILAAYHRLGEP